MMASTTPKIALLLTFVIGSYIVYYGITLDDVMSLALDGVYLKNTSDIFRRRSLLSTVPKEAVQNKRIENFAKSRFKREIPTAREVVDANSGIVWKLNVTIAKIGNSSSSAPSNENETKLWNVFENDHLWTAVNVEETDFKRGDGSFNKTWSAIDNLFKQLFKRNIRNMMDDGFVLVNVTSSDAVRKEKLVQRLSQRKNIRNDNIKDDFGFGWKLIVNVTEPKNSSRKIHLTDITQDAGETSLNDNLRTFISIEEKDVSLSYTAFDFAFEVVQNFLKELYGKNIQGLIEYGHEVLVDIIDSPNSQIIIGTTDNKQSRRKGKFLPFFFGGGGGNMENPPKEEITSVQLEKSTSTQIEAGSPTVNKLVTDSMIINILSENSTERQNSSSILTAFMITQSPLRTSISESVSTSAFQNEIPSQLNSTENLERKNISGITESSSVTSATDIAERSDINGSLIATRTLEMFANTILEKQNEKPRNFDELRELCKNLTTQIKKTQGLVTEHSVVNGTIEATPVPQEIISDSTVVSQSEKPKNLGFFSSLLNRITGRKSIRNSENGIELISSNQENLNILSAKRNISMDFNEKNTKSNVEEETGRNEINTDRPEFDCETFLRSIQPNLITKPNLFDVMENRELFKQFMSLSSIEINDITLSAQQFQMHIKDETTELSTEISEFHISESTEQMVTLELQNPINDSVELLTTPSFESQTRNMFTEPQLIEETFSGIEDLNNNDNSREFFKTTEIASTMNMLSIENDTNLGIENSEFRLENSTPRHERDGEELLTVPSFESQTRNMFTEPILIAETFAGIKDKQETGILDNNENSREFFQTTEIASSMNMLSIENVTDLGIENLETRLENSTLQNESFFSNLFGFGSGQRDLEESGTIETKHFDTTPTEDLQLIIRNFDSGDVNVLDVYNVTEVSNTADEPAHGIILNFSEGERSLDSTVNVGLDRIVQEDVTAKSDEEDTEVKGRFFNPFPVGSGDLITSNEDERRFLGFLNVGSGAGRDLLDNNSVQDLEISKTNNFQTTTEKVADAKSRFFLGTLFLTGSGNGGLFENSNGDINFVPETETNSPVFSPNSKKSSRRSKYPGRGRGMRRLDDFDPFDESVDFSPFDGLAGSSPSNDSIGTNLSNNSIGPSPSSTEFEDSFLSTNQPTEMSTDVEKANNINSTGQGPDFNGTQISSRFETATVSPGRKFHSTQFSKSQLKSCATSTDCSAILNERCLIYGNKTVCTCLTSAIRHPETGVCEVATWLRILVKLPHEKYHRDLKDRSTKRFQKTRKEAVESMHLLLDLYPEFLPSVAEVDVLKFKKGSLIVHWNFVLASFSFDVPDAALRRVKEDLLRAFSNFILLRSAPLNFGNATIMSMVPSTNPCETDICSENSECNQDDFHALRCLCKEGFVDQSASYPGEFCAEACPFSYCGDHGQCRLKPRGKKHCMCSEWYFGSRCEIPGIVIIVSFSGVIVLVVSATLIAVCVCSRRRGRSKFNLENEFQFNADNSFTSHFTPQTIAELQKGGIKHSKYIHFSTPMRNLPVVKITCPSVGSALSYDSTFDVTPSLGETSQPNSKSENKV